MLRHKHLSIFIIFCSILFLFGNLQSQGKIRAYLNYAFFIHPEKGAYIETYFSIDGTSVKYILNDNGKFQANIAIAMFFKQDEKIIEYDSYNLKSDELADTLNLAFNIIDQQRYFISEGYYDFSMRIQDLNTSSPPLEAEIPIYISFPADSVCFSGIQFIDQISPTKEQTILTKGGYDLVPYVFSYFPKSSTKLTFYTEIYNTQKFFGVDSKFLVRGYLRSFESELILNEYFFFKKIDAAPVVPILNEFDISGLPTGNYILELEVRDKQNCLITSGQLFFERNNPDVELSLSAVQSIDISDTFAGQITDQDTLMEYIKCIVPKATQQEQSFIFKKIPLSDLVTMQQFFFNFWYIRYPNDPKEAWLQYFELVNVVNDRYSTQVHKGYETDRGRVYLKYGPPNTISESYYEPASYPYEIWHYYKLGDNQTNKKFVFWTEDVIMNNFYLLHSDAIGEVSNIRWQNVLNSRWHDPYDRDNLAPVNIWGDEAMDYYLNPR